MYVTCRELFCLCEIIRRNSVFLLSESSIRKIKEKVLVLRAGKRGAYAGSRSDGILVDVFIVGTAGSIGSGVVVILGRSYGNDGNTCTKLFFAKVIVIEAVLICGNVNYARLIIQGNGDGDSCVFYSCGAVKVDEVRAVFLQIYVTANCICVLHGKVADLEVFSLESFQGVVGNLLGIGGVFLHVILTATDCTKIYGGRPSGNGIFYRSINAGTG